MFIAFDGSDGSGKSTQIKMLHDHLKSQGKDPLVLDHPTHDGFGAVVRRTLHKEKQRLDPRAEAFFYAADFVETMVKHIKPAVAAGRPVLMHRWWYSGVVYQAGIDGADWDDVYNICQLAVGDYLPNVGLILVCQPKVAMQRIGTRKGEIVSPYENEKDLQQAFELYSKVVPTFRGRTGCEPLYQVDTTTATPEETHADIRTLTGL